MTEGEHRPLIVCALEYERAMLGKAGLDQQFTIDCCGPGAQGVRRWASQANPQCEVILAGLAGALNPTLKPASVCSVNTVIASDGERWVPAIVPDCVITASITSTVSIVKDKASRCALHAATGADLVDLESLEFARIASERKWKWAILRAVSDDDSFELPTDIDQWNDEHGRTKPLAIARSIVRSPRTLATLHRLARDGGAAMHELSESLQKWHSSLSQTSS